jgi:hypothetical protein
MSQRTGHEDDNLHYAERMVRVMRKIQQNDPIGYYVLATINTDGLVELLADALNDNQTGGEQ